MPRLQRPSLPLTIRSISQAVIETMSTRCRAVRRLWARVPSLRAVRPTCPPARLGPHRVLRSSSGTKGNAPCRIAPPSCAIDRRNCLHGRDHRHRDHALDLSRHVVARDTTIPHAHHHANGVGPWPHRHDQLSRRRHRNPWPRRLLSRHTTTDGGGLNRSADHPLPRR